MDRFKLSAIFWFIVTIPIIDLLTTLSMHLPITIGAIIRPLLMSVLFIIILYFLYNNNRKLLVLFLIPFVYLGLSFVFQLMTKQPFFFKDELQFYMKTAFFVIILFTVFIIQPMKHVPKSVLIKAIQIATFIVVISYWIAVLTGTSLNSYPYNKSGFSGWFFAANELSVIILILLAFSLIHLWNNFNMKNFLLFITVLSITPMIGTKTSFYGAIILLMFYISGLLFSLKLKNLGAVLIPCVILLIIVPNTPVINNTFPEANDNTTLMEKSENENNLNNILSSRDDYLRQTKSEFVESSLAKKLFGLGYAGNYKTEPKTIEMDFYDLFFSYGIIGLILMLYPLLFVISQIFRFKQFTFDYLFLLFTAFLCLGIAFFVGHIIFAPAVMSYVGVLLLTLKLLNQEMIINAR